MHGVPGPHEGVVFCAADVPTIGSRVGVARRVAKLHAPRSKRRMSMRSAG